MSSSPLQSLIAIIRNFLHTFPRPAYMNVAAGFCCGIILGVVPMLIHFQSLLSNCRLAATQTECGNVIPLVCQWDKTHGVCLGSSSICDPTWSSSTCADKGASSCEYNIQRNQCEQVAGWGWDNNEMGWVASSAVIGAMLGTFVSSLASKQEQVKRLTQFAMTVVIGTLVGWGCWLFFNHSSGLTGTCFLVVGLGLGGFFALTPATVASVVAPSTRAFAGTFFQLAIVFGIVTAAFVALIFSAFHPLVPNILFIMQAAVGAGTFYVADSFFTPIYNSSLNGENNNSNNVPTTTVAGPIETGNAALPSSSSTSELMEHVPRTRISNIASDGPNTIDGFFPNEDISQITNNNTIPTIVDGSSSAPQDVEGPRSLVGQGQIGDSPIPTTSAYAQQKQQLIKMCYICGFFLAASLQLTGINAIMAFSSKISKSAGIENPLLGNFIIMLWNALACLPSVALGQRYAPNFLYMVGLVGGSIFCFLAAGAMTIGSPALSLLCVCGFLLFFETCQGPMFFTLATEIFPPEIRANAAARVNLVNFFWNVVVNYSYPALCDALMPVGDRAGGVKRVFILFGFLGLGTGVALYLLFPKTFMGKYTSHQKANTPDVGSINASSRETPPPPIITENIVESPITATTPTVLLETKNSNQQQQSGF